MYQKMEQLLNSQLYPHQWIQLTMETRDFLRKTFDIPQTGGASVVDNRVESDGTTVEDLKFLTLEKMQVYLGSQETNFLNLLEECVKNYYKNNNGEQNNVESKQQGEKNSEDKGTNKRGYKKTGRGKKISAESKTGTLSAVA